MVSEDDLISDDAIVDGDEPFQPLNPDDEERASKKARKPEKKRRKVRTDSVHALK